MGREKKLKEPCAGGAGERVFSRFSPIQRTKHLQVFVRLSILTFKPTLFRRSLLVSLFDGDWDYNRITLCLSSRLAWHDLELERRKSKKPSYSLTYCLFAPVSLRSWGIDSYFWTKVPGQWLSGLFLKEAKLEKKMWLLPKIVIAGFY